MNIFNQLNEQQKQAVSHLHGPALVIASAGAGKTRVLTCRIAHLLNMGVSPHSILAITFTNKAAENMKKQIIRFSPQVESNMKYLWMGTFHSIFAKILRFEHQYINFTPNYTIYDRQDSLNLLKTIIKELHLDEKEDYKPNVVLNKISLAKNNLINPKDYEANFEKFDKQYFKYPKMPEIYLRYVNRCKQADAMDFDDLLLNFSNLLSSEPIVLEKYQKKFQYILVDEFQDTNYAQATIIKKLAALHKNIFVVGDDYQSIYAFRGADLNNILNFKNEYPDCDLYKLEQNYRSTQQIIYASNSVIKNNSKQHKKTVFSKNEIGNKIKILTATTDMEEGFLVAQSIYIDNYVNDISLNQIAILYRTNFQSRVFEEALRRKNIPYQIFGGLSFYQRKEIKDIIAYFRYVINPNDEEAFKRIINYPRRGIGTITINKIVSEIESSNQTLSSILNNVNQHIQINKGTASKLSQFAFFIENCKKNLEHFSAYEMANYIYKESKIKEALLADKSPEGMSRYNNVEELLNDTQAFSNTEKALGNPNDLTSYLEKISLFTNLDEEQKISEQKVTLMTIHSAKGLEFENIYIVGVEEKLLPSYGTKENIDNTQLEEERRLFYVALTRAMKKVTITHAKMRYKWGDIFPTIQSRFINEIDKQYINDSNHLHFSETLDPQNFSIKKPIIKFKSNNKKFQRDNYSAKNVNNIQVGMNIVHLRFGKGKILALEGDLPDNKKATVFFQAVGQKKLLLKYAKLKVIP